MLSEIFSPRKAVTVDISTTDHIVTARGVYVGTSGNLVVELVDNPGTSVTYYNIAAGVEHPMAISKVVRTGTTASQLLALI